MGNTRPTVRVGVFIPKEAQLLDAACVDIFAIAGHGYLGLCKGLVPAHIIDLAPTVEILYVSQSPAGAVVPLTAGMRIVVDRHLSADDVAPGTLDVVLVPGPDPKATHDGEALDWLAAHCRAKVDVLSVCTGIFLCGEAGILAGRRACGPRGMQDLLAKKFEGVTWVGDELRWVQDGNFWSSGGITNGNDLVAAYIRQSPHFPGPVAEMALMMADAGDRPQKYGQSKPAFVISIVWTLFRGWLMSMGRPKYT
ncbi:hypothetical protein MAPG_02641 [Magnaporthiopsis poae ATCC 64411]|uniref:DJ-1/PfpI domain-containing protein n=1 Tax=Magnaporthiopsis poae (strain ATCC 64411 / 73-15) TaxID=644358 RepID=A0A0C4DRX3_MAGP6|nr:hypothetical protein MAPG_02641 [Magnaporthiopsis poae ATCC 64411]